MRILRKVLRTVLRTIGRAILVAGIIGMFLTGTGEWMGVFHDRSIAAMSERLSEQFAEQISNIPVIGTKSLEESDIEEFVGVPYVKDILPISNKRPGRKRRIKYIVVHNTANETSTARNERDYLSNPMNTASTSWHIVVDNHEMIEAVPVNEVAFHAGDREGNQYGIGIELCESEDMTKTEKNAAKLIAYLMKEYRIPIENVKTHKDFSGKECPRQTLMHWESFKNKIQEAYNDL